MPWIVRGARVQLVGARSDGGNTSSVVTAASTAKDSSLDGFAVTFVTGKGRATLMKGRGRIALEPEGVRLVGPRARVDAAFYGACAIGLAGAVVAFAVAAWVGGPYLLTRGVGIAPLLIGAALCVLALLNIAHAILIRALPFRTEDRRLAFASNMSVETADAAARIVTDERGFMGATWFVFEGGPSERARFIDELETARRGGASGYRESPRTAEAGDPEAR